MKTLRGTVFFEGLEGGTWVFKTEDGATYQLSGGGEDLRRQGKRFSVTGVVDEEMMSFAMVGPVLQVKEYRPL